MTHRLPLLAVVTGRAGAGKTTLANQLAQRIRCPLVSRDAILEGLAHTVGTQHTQDDETKLAVYNTFFENIELLLRARVSLVADAAFQHARWAHKLEPMRPLCDLRIIVCDLSPDLSWRRVKQRDSMDPERGQFHVMPEPNAKYDPPVLDVPTLKLETSATLDSVVNRALDFISKG